MARDQEIALLRMAEFSLAGRVASAYIFAPSPCGGMADAIDSKSIAARHGGSTPSTGTSLRSPLFSVVRHRIIIQIKSVGYARQRAPETGTDRWQSERLLVSVLVSNQFLNSVPTHTQRPLHSSIQTA